MDLSEKCSFENVNVFDWLKANTAAKPHEKLVPRWDTDHPRSAVLYAQPRLGAGCASRIQGNPFARAQAAEDRWHACHVLLLAPCRCRVVSGHRARGSIRCPEMLRRVATYSQSPDHPIIPMIPETEYLKGFAFEVVR